MRKGYEIAGSGIVVAVGAETASERALRDMSESRAVTQWLVLESMFADGDDFSVTRKARCLMDHDDYSLKKGETIAGARADLAFHARMAEGYDRSVAELEKALDEAKRQRVRHLSEARHAQEVLERVLK